MNRNAIYASVIVILSIGLLTSLAGTATLVQQNTKLKEAVTPEPDVPVEGVAETEPAPAVDGIADSEDYGDMHEEYQVLLSTLEKERERIAELQARLDERRVSVPDQVQPPQPARHERGGNRRTDWMARREQEMERLKEEDPERYEQMQKDRNDRRTAIKKTIEDQYSFIYGLDTEKMTESQLENHEALVALLEKNWEYMAIIEDPESDEQAWEARRGMMHSMHQANDLLDEEREVALYQVGQSMGYTDAEAKEFADNIEYVYDMTSVGTYFQAFRGGRRMRSNRSGGSEQ